MITEKMSFKINTISIPSDIQAKSIFLCFQIDDVKFYTVSQKKVCHQIVKFYGQLVEVQIPQKSLNISIIDNSIKNSLKLLKRISINTLQLSQKNVLYLIKEEDKFQLKFQIIYDMEKESQFQTSFSDSLIFQQEQNHHQRCNDIENKKRYKRKNSSESNYSTQDEQYNWKRSGTCLEDLKNCSKIVYKCKNS